MSKESYARGFCKAAAAAGVDPVALAKYAQQYKTEGYYPGRDVPSYSPNIAKIPQIFSDGATFSVRDADGDLVNPGETSGMRYTSGERVRQVANPRHLAWLQAHTNALSKATAPLREADFPARSTAKIPADVTKILEKMYHDEMKRTTSAPPVQVSAPVKKPANGQRR